MQRSESTTRLYIQNISKLYISGTDLNQEVKDNQAKVKKLLELNKVQQSGTYKETYKHG